MLAVVSTPGGSVPAELREVAEPRAAPNEVVLSVEAFGINRGELSLLPNRPSWQPGQDVVVPDIPLTAVGKPDKPALRSQVTAELEGAQR